MNSTLSNQELDDSFGYNFQEDQGLVAKSYDENEDDRHIVTSRVSGVQSSAAATPGEMADGLQHSGKGTNANSPIVRSKSDMNNHQVRARSHAATEPKTVRALVPKSFVTNLPVPNFHQRLMPAQSVVKRSEQSILKYAGTGSTLHQPWTFYIGKQPRTQSPFFQDQIVENQENTNNRHGYKGGKPWRFVPPPKAAVPPNISNLNKLLMDQSSTSLVYNNHLALSLDQQQQDMLGLKNGKADHLPSNFLKVLKLEANGVSNSLDTGLGSKTSRKAEREKDSFRLHLKDPHSTFQQLISSSKQYQPQDDLRASQTSRVGGQSGRQHLLNRLTLDLGIGNSYNNFTDHAFNTGRTAGGAETVRNIGIGAFTSKMSLPSQLQYSSYNRSYLPEPFISGKALPFTNILPKIVVSQSTVSSKVKQLTLVDKPEMGDSYYHLIGLDHHRTLLKKFPEKNPHFTVLPTMLSPSAFKSAESRQFPIRSVNSPRPSSQNTMSTIAI